MAVALSTKLTILALLVAGTLLAWIMKNIHNAIAIILGIATALVLVWILIGL